MADDNDLLAAINGALDNPEAPAADETPVAEETTEETTAEATPESTEETVAETAEESAEETAEEPAAEIKELTAEEKAAADTAKPAEATKTEEPKAAEPAKPRDHLNDPIDGRLKADTRERITSLVQSVRTVTAERDEIMSHIQNTGASPEQYSQALQYLSAVNSGDPRVVEQAITFLQNELVSLGRLVGKPVQGVDFASNHKDLIEAVEKGSLTPELAQELAVQRDRNAQITQQYERQEQTQAQQQQERQQAVQGLNALGAELQQTDPGYASRSAAVMQKLQAKDASGASLLSRTAPSQWQALFLKHYAVTPAQAPVARQQMQRTAAPVVAQPVRQQPLRARQPAGSGSAAPQPKSLEDAIFGAIDKA